MSFILKRASILAVIALSQLGGFGVSAFAGTGQNSFMPTSFKIPIWSINLIGTLTLNPNGTGGPGGTGSGGSGGTSSGGSTGSGVGVYVCPGPSESNCEVDIANPAALTALTQSAKVAPGTYTGISIQTVPNSAMGTGTPSFHAFVKGSVVLSGTTYYTTSVANPLSTLPSQNDYSQVTITNGNMSFNFPSALTVNAGDTVAISLFVTLGSAAYASVNDSFTQGGCVTDNSLHSVCINLPQVVPYVGTTSPTAQTYNIYAQGSNPNTAAGQLILILTSAGDMVGGFFHPLYSPTSTSAMNQGQYVTPVASFAKNADGTYNLASYAGGSSNLPLQSFPSFALLAGAGATANGTASTLAGSSTVSFNYTAQRQ